eukprot:707756-Pyramimonas_sp.AAC.1
MVREAVWDSPVSARADVFAVTKSPLHLAGDAFSRARWGAAKCFCSVDRAGKLAQRHLESRLPKLYRPHRSSSAPTERATVQ